MAEPHKSVNPANISWDASGHPFSNDYQDIYYSKADALSESTFVFLNANRLEERWHKMVNPDFIIGECGFGGGLNFLNTCRLWCKSADPGSVLHYLALELHPFHKTDLRQLHQLYPEFQMYSDSLLAVYPPLCPGIHQRELTVDQHRIVLTLAFGDASIMLGKIWQANGFRVDAWYLDGFTPTRNPSMWNDKLCARVAALSKAGTTLTTYSASGLIKNALQQNGFSISRKAGFAAKRHMLCATYTAGNAEQNNTVNDRIPLNITQSFFRTPNHTAQHKNVLIIGAGLAGCSSAHVLAASGWQVTLIDREESIANKASGNTRAIVNCKLSNSRDASSDFYMHAYLYAVQHYKQLAKIHRIDWTPCGILQLAYNEREQTRQNQYLLKPHASQFVYQADALGATEKAGVKLNSDALFLPDSGYINPKALCHAYLQHDAITCLTATEALYLQQHKNGWEVFGPQGSIARTDVVIIANAQDAHNFEQCRHYPLLSNVGQIDEFPQTESSRNLACVLCARAYILPAADGTHCIGGSTATAARLSENVCDTTRRNLQLLATVSPELSEDFSGQAAQYSRSGTRCSSPDYLPLVGAVENWKLSQEIYKELARNARKNISTPPVYEPGLYINVAHGSHGLTSTPLAAAYLAGLLDNTPLPASNDVLSCLHPLRFLIKDLQKQRLSLT